MCYRTEGSSEIERKRNICGGFGYLRDSDIPISAWNKCLCVCECVFNDFCVVYV